MRECIPRIKNCSKEKEGIALKYLQMMEPQMVETIVKI